MKAFIVKNKSITISGITHEQFMTMSAILNAANYRCFEEHQENGDYHSNDDFVVVLTESGRKALSEVCKTI